MNQDQLAQALFDYFNNVRGDVNAPHSYNEDEPSKTIFIDGNVDCREVAAFILNEVPKPA